MIVETTTFLTLLGGGSVTSAEIALAVARAPILVAADGGAEAALAEGILPEAVIGDFDSISPEVLEALDPARVHHVAEQDSTDFEKTLARVSAPLMLAAGFTGRRRDHELAALHGLMRFPQKRVILITEADAICLCPPSIAIDLPRACRVSLFPLARVAGTSSGLRWPIDGLAFAPGHRIGTSNMANGETVRLTMTAPAMLLILPLGQIDALIAALTGPATAWPGLGATGGG